MNQSIELSITVRATASEIWSALTDPDELENWWSEEVRLDARVGGQFHEVWEDDSGKRQTASGKVLSCSKHKLITFSWQEKTWPPTAHTQCTFQIEDLKKHRVLHVQHTGWETLPESLQKKSIQDFTLGWKYHLKELKSYVDEELD